MTPCSMNARSIIFFTRILARAQISSLTSEGFFIKVLSVTILETTKTGQCSCNSYRRFYRSQFWRLQKHSNDVSEDKLCFIGHNFGDYKNSRPDAPSAPFVLSVTILETTKTYRWSRLTCYLFYRSQFWRLQKQATTDLFLSHSFIGHNFGDYKNLKWYQLITP